MPKWPLYQLLSPQTISYHLHIFTYAHDIVTFFNHGHYTISGNISVGDSVPIIAVY